MAPFSEKLSSLFERKQTESQERLLSDWDSPEGPSAALDNVLSSPSRVYFPASRYGQQGGPASSIHPKSGKISPRVQTLHKLHSLPALQMKGQNAVREQSVSSPELSPIPDEDIGLKFPTLSVGTNSEHKWFQDPTFNLFPRRPRRSTVPTTVMAYRELAGIHQVTETSDSRAAAISGPSQTTRAVTGGTTAGQKVGPVAKHRRKLPDFEFPKLNVAQHAETMGDMYFPGIDTDVTSADGDAIEADLTETGSVLHKAWLGDNASAGSYYSLPSNVHGVEPSMLNESGQPNSQSKDEATNHPDAADGGISDHGSPNRQGHGSSKAPRSSPIPGIFQTKAIGSKRIKAIVNQLAISASMPEELESRSSPRAKKVSGGKPPIPAKSFARVQSMQMAAQEGHNQVAQTSPDVDAFESSDAYRKTVALIETPTMRQKIHAVAANVHGCDRHQSKSDSDDKALGQHSNIPAITVTHSEVIVMPRFSTVIDGASEFDDDCDISLCSTNGVAYDQSELDLHLEEKDSCQYHDDQFSDERVSPVVRGRHKTIGTYTSRYRSPTPPLLFGRRTKANTVGSTEISQPSLVHATSGPRITSDTHSEKAGASPDFSSGDMKYSTEKVHESSGASVDQTMEGSSFADISDSGSLSMQQVTGLDQGLRLESNSRAHLKHPRYSNVDAFQHKGSAKTEEVVKDHGQRVTGHHNTPLVSATVSSSGPAYNHPAPLAFSHINPFNLLHSAALGSSHPTSINEMANTSSSNSREFQSSSSSASVMEERPPRVPIKKAGDSIDSSAWLSTVAEAQSETYSPTPYSSSFKKFTYLGIKDNITGTPQGSGIQEAGSSLADASSPVPDLQSSPQAVSGGHHAVTSITTPRQVHLYQASRTSDRYGGSEIFNSSDFSQLSNASSSIEGAISAVRTPTKSTTATFNANKSAKNGSTSNYAGLTPRHEHSARAALAELAHDQVNWSEEVRRYLPSRGPRTGRAQQVLDSPTAKFEAGEFIEMKALTAAKKKIDDEETQLSMTHRSNNPAPAQVHPVYGTEHPNGLSRQQARHINRLQQPAARPESPHIRDHRVLSTSEREKRERFLSISIALLCCLAIVPAWLYCHGLLDGVMSHLSDGEFNQFRTVDKYVVMAFIYTVFVLAMVAIPLLMVIVA